PGVHPYGARAGGRDQGLSGPGVRVPVHERAVGAPSERGVSAAPHEAQRGREQAMSNKEGESMQQEVVSLPAKGVVRLSNNQRAVCVVEKATRKSYWVRW